MIFEKIKTEGLAHLSYIIGDGMEAVVIDPRRDCQVYIDIASAHGMRIRRIFETHRNEDFVVGSLDLAGKTGLKWTMVEAKNDSIKAARTKPSYILPMVQVRCVLLSLPRANFPP